MNNSIFLIVDKDTGVKDYLFRYKADIAHFTANDIIGYKIETFVDKLKFLWTIRCVADNIDVEEEKVDEFTSMLKSLFPNVNFVELTTVADITGVKELFNNDLLYNELFIKSLLSFGQIYYISPTYSCYDRCNDYITNNLKLVIKG